MEAVDVDAGLNLACFASMDITSSLTRFSCFLLACGGFVELIERGGMLRRMQGCGAPRCGRGAKQTMHRRGYEGNIQSKFAQICF